MCEVYGYPTILLSDGTREFIGCGDGEETDAYFQQLIRESDKRQRKRLLMQSLNQIIDF